jgi:hypothetical protein
MVDITNNRAQARDIAVAINHEGAQCPAFTRASQNVAMVAMFLDTVLTPSVNVVDNVYRQLKDILGIAAARQVESSLQCWAEVSILRPSHSKANRQNVATKLSMAGTTSSPAYISTRVRPCHLNRHPKPRAHH